MPPETCALHLQKIELYPQSLYSKRVSTQQLLLVGMLADLAGATGLSTRQLSLHRDRVGTQQLLVCAEQYPDICPTHIHAEARPGTMPLSTGAQHEARLCGRHSSGCSQR
jgi:hypothetical protein